MHIYNLLVHTIGYFFVSLQCVMKKTIFFLLLFFATASTCFSQVFEQKAIPDSIWKTMLGKSVPADIDKRPGAYAIKRSDLRYLRISHYDDKGAVHVGEMICNKRIAGVLLDIFRELYKAHYPIQRMRLIDNYDAKDALSMADNNTSCFCYRAVTGGKSISKHGLGLAIDINPLYNPYVKGNIVEPIEGKKYANRKRNDIPMKIDHNDICYKLFIKNGFKWGGSWTRTKDYQHFEIN